MNKATTMTSSTSAMRANTCRDMGINLARERRKGPGLSARPLSVWFRHAREARYSTSGVT
jgi:hypothetical protein